MTKRIPSLSKQIQKTEGIFDHPKSSAVIATDADFTVCFVQSVASTDRTEDLSFAAAVKSTDRSFAR